MQFDVEKDIEQLRRQRTVGILAAGEQFGADRIRDAGGFPLSDRAAVLLEHMLRAHIMAAMGAARDVDALACLRRFVEYVGALEVAALVPFSAEDWDTPRTVLGLAAAALEGLVKDYPGIPADAVVDDETRTQIEQGVQAFTDMAAKLRQMEERIGDVPGQDPMTVVELPTPTITLPGTAPGS